MRRRSGLQGSRIIGRPHAKAWVLALLCAAAAGQAVAADEPAEPGWSYTFGHGLRHEGAGLTLGGYVTAEAQSLSGRPGQLRISHTSVFLWWEPVERLKLLAELDQENAIARDRQPRPGGPPAQQPERRTSLERLHANWTFGDAFVLRAGKFLTPVGQWNLQHADPLTWTANRPLLTQTVFPNNLTGLMASGRQAWEAAAEPVLDYALYASNGGEWAPDPRQDQFSTVRGGRLQLTIDGRWRIGASYARYQQQASRGEQRSLSGLDLRYAHAGFELSGEWLRTAALRPAVPVPRNGQRALRPAPPPLAAGPADGAADPAPGLVPGPGAVQRQVFVGVPTQGGYVQAVVPVVQRVFAVARVERLRNALAPQALRQSTLGVVWRPNPPFTVKLEHQWTRGRADLAPEGFTATVSVLF